MRTIRAVAKYDWRPLRLDRSALTRPGLVVHESAAERGLRGPEVGPGEVASMLGKIFVRRIDLRGHDGFRHGAAVAVAVGAGEGFRPECSSPETHRAVPILSSERSLNA